MTRMLLALVLASTLTPAESAEIVDGDDLQDGIAGCGQWSAIKLDSQVFGYSANVACVRALSVTSALRPRDPVSLYHCRRKMSEGVACEPPTLLK